MNRLLVSILSTALLSLSQFCLAQSGSLLQDVEKQWAVANYELTGDPQIKAFEQLITTVDKYLDSHPKAVNLWVWSGIVKSTLAGAEGGLSALSLAKAARKDLQRSLSLDDSALNGSAYTSLGTLYHNVPGWPIGFGSDKKARQLFQKALHISPHDIDANYFYARYLYDEGEYAQSQKYLLAARNAPPRPGRPLADKGRQREISTLLQQVKKELKD